MTAEQTTGRYSGAGRVIFTPFEPEKDGFVTPDKAISQSSDGDTTVYLNTDKGWGATTPIGLRKVEASEVQLLEKLGRLANQVEKAERKDEKSRP